jgi:hypothetical protein
MRAQSCAPGLGGGPPLTPVPPRDATAPRIRLLSPGRQKLSRLRGRGLAFR